MDWTNIVLAAAPSILSGVVLFKIQTKNKKDEKSEEMRKEESFLIMKNIDAIGCLAEQTARCIRGEKPNGELTKALDYRSEQKHALKDYLIKATAEHNSKVN